MKNLCKVRNGAIDVIKFVCCLFVVMYHFNIYTETKQYFAGGKFGVEIFCIIAGAFFFKKFLKYGDARSTWHYTRERFMRFFPYTTTAFICIYISYIYSGGGYTIKKIIGQLFEHIPEILLIDMAGFNEGGSLLNSPAWTISCLFIVETCAWGVLRQSKQNFFDIILPLSMVLIYGIWFNHGKINHRTWLGVINFGILQVWCDVMWGILAIFLSEKIKHISRVSRALTIVEALCYTGAFWLMLSHGEIRYGFLITLMAFGGVSITLSNRSYSRNWFRDSKCTQFLGRISLLIYLNHSVMLKVFFNKFGPENMFKMWPVFLMVLVVFCIFQDMLLRKIVKYIERYIQLIKKHYCIENV